LDPVGQPQAEGNGEAVNDRSDRFFAWVWRINGLLLLCLALLATGLALYLAVNIGMSTAQERPEEQLSEVAGTDLAARDLRLADFRPIAGTGFIYAELASPSDYIGSGSSGSPGNAANLLFFDTASKKAHWLLPTNDQKIPSFSFLMNPPGARYGYADGSGGSKDQVAIGILVETEDDRPSASARTGSRNLLIVSPDGLALTPIARSVQGLLGYHHARKDALFVFYVSGGAAKVLDVDPVTRQVRSDTPLATHE